MKRKILITALIAIGLSLSGVSHAVPLSITKPDGTKTVANVEGNKLMLRDATGKLWISAGDGTYKTNDGKTLIVKGGIIAAQSGSTAAPIIGPLDNKAKGKGGIIGPNFNPPASPMKQGPGKLLPAVQKPSASGMGGSAATRGGMVMESDKPEPKPGPKPDKMMAPRMGGSAATRGGMVMESDKPEPKPGPKPDKMMAPRMGGSAATRGGLLMDKPADKMTTPRMGGPAAAAPGGLRQGPCEPDC
mgnify:CR=1 FL=1